MFEFSEDSSFLENIIEEYFIKRSSLKNDGYGPWGQGSCFFYYQNEMKVTHDLYDLVLLRFYHIKTEIILYLCSTIDFIEPKENCKLQSSFSYTS